VKCDTLKHITWFEYNNSNCVNGSGGGGSGGDNGHSDKSINS